MLLQNPTKLDVKKLLLEYMFGKVPSTVRVAWDDDLAHVTRVGWPCGGCAYHDSNNSRIISKRL